MDEGGDERDQPRWFVLQARDLTTGCAILETRFLVDDLAILHDILGDDANPDPNLDQLYQLDQQALQAIKEGFRASIDEGDHEVWLVPWHGLRDAPYLIHTNFELPLMLEGRKPFAKFSEFYPSDWFDEQILKFDPFVAAGRLIRRVVTWPFEPPTHLANGRIIRGMREIYFALPGEEWRIDAYLLLNQVMRKTGWNDGLERYEGLLLGYEDWQNDWWIAHMHTRREATKEIRERIKAERQAEELQSD
ncbi:hypothetical protein AB4072_08565 [Microvirga sp. 2MCAF38]|uniref:hypothetical protein n=1 Tax=Microvirga sp. 2MCAF38 TaxID=3232989 RepID=UPI003F9ABB4B